MGSCGGATKVWLKIIEHFMVHYHCKVHGEEGLQILGGRNRYIGAAYISVCKSCVLLPSKNDT